MAWLLRELADPRYVAMFQKWCGVELVEDTESQETSRIPTVSCSRTPEDSCGHTGDYISDHRDNTTSCCCRHHHLSPEEEARQRRASPTNYDNNNCMCKNVATSVTVCNGHCASAALSSTNGHFQNYPCTHLNKLSKGAPVSSAYERSTVCENKLTTNGYCTSISSDSVTPNSGNDASNALKTGDKHIFQYSNGNARGGHYARELTTSTTTARPASKIPTRISIRYPLVHAWARLGAVLGNEEFYLSVFPFLLWSVDSLVIRQTAMLWCLVMYLGQATKDYLRWPRPPSPPVIRLETQHLQEFSMPSTHAMAGTAIPLLLSRLLLERYEVSGAKIMSGKNDFK